MESLPEISTTALTTICGLACGVLILLGGGIFMLLRSGLVSRLLGSAGGLLNGTDDVLGHEGLFGDESTRSPIRRDSSHVTDRVAEIRQRYDRAFEDGTEPPVHGEASDPIQPEAHPSALTDAELRRDKARYKRRFRRENPDRDDEMDAFFDDMEL